MANKQWPMADSLRPKLSLFNRSLWQHHPHAMKKVALIFVLAVLLPRSVNWQECEA